MRGILVDCYRALQALPAALSRGCPQADLPLPHIMLSLMEDRLLDSGERLQSLGIRLRAASPEAADQLAESVDEALSRIRLTRRGCLDGAEHDRGSFLKIMRFERLLPPEGLPDVRLHLLGREHQAQVISCLRERALYEGPDMRPLPGKPLRATLRLRLPLMALPDVENLWAGGEAVSYSQDGLPGQAHMSRYSLAAGRLTIDLHPL